MSDTTTKRTGTLHPASEQAQRPVRVPEQRDENAPAREGQELVDAAARSHEGRDKLTNEEQVNALDWFLSDTDATDLTYTFEINVGSPTNKRWIEWTIQPVDLDKLRRIRRKSQAQQSRRQRAQGATADFDEVTANVQIVLEGTISPDLRAASKEIGTVDPADAVRGRFEHKPGLLAQIAGEIMAISGYDDDDVREVDAARG